MAFFLSNYGLFVAKLATFFVIFAFFVIVIASVFGRRGDGATNKGKLRIEDLNKRYQNLGASIKNLLLTKKQLKLENKKNKKQKNPPPAKNIFVIDFVGDVKASALNELRESISAILLSAQTGDEVMLRLESAGGLVHSYGLAAAQLIRIKEHKLKLTICVDKVAASGGYMMACVADHIIAAPFAIIGSIGVVAMLPNINKALKKKNVDIEYHTAGQYKRTLSMLGENTAAGRKKFTQDMEHTHELFKQFINTYRPTSDINKLATGETWYGTDALDKGLVDEINTSDSYLIQQSKNAKQRIFAISYKEKKKLADRFSNSLRACWSNLLPF